MSKNFISTTSINTDEYPEITQSDINRSVFRRGLKPVNKNKISISLDADIVEFFKNKAGDKDYQELINDTLKKLIAA